MYCAALYSMSCSLCLLYRVCILVDLNLSTTCSVWVRWTLNKHRYWWDAQHGCQASCRMKCEQGVGMSSQPAVTFFMSASLVSYAMQKVVSLNYLSVLEEYQLQCTCTAFPAMSRLCALQRQRCFISDSPALQPPLVLLASTLNGRDA